MTETLEDGGDNLGTGCFGRVRLDCRTMSACHLDSSFAEHGGRWMCFRSVCSTCAHSQVDVYEGLRMHILMCFCCYKCDSDNPSHC